jgi:hypothetical protein
MIPTAVDAPVQHATVLADTDVRYTSVPIEVGVSTVTQAPAPATRTELMLESFKNDLNQALVSRVCDVCDAQLTQNVDCVATTYHNIVDVR